jgi:hypothetical protein
MIAAETPVPMAEVSNVWSISWRGGLGSSGTDYVSEVLQV